MLANVKSYLFLVEKNNMKKFIKEWFEFNEKDPITSIMFLCLLVGVIIMGAIIFFMWVALLFR